MADELQIAYQNKMGPVEAVPIPMSQYGDNNMQIGYAANVTNNINVTYAGNQAMGMSMGMRTEINSRYYNLFVVESIENQIIKIPRTKALCDSIKDSVRKKFARCGETEQAEIKKMPSIFASANHNHRSTDATHFAWFGFVNNITIQQDNIVVECNPKQQILQQSLNSLECELQIDHSPDSNEFESVHWTIKEVNLLQVLQDKHLLRW